MRERLDGEEMVRGRSWRGKIGRRGAGQVGRGVYACQDRMTESLHPYKGVTGEVSTACRAR